MAFVAGLANDQLQLKQALILACTSNGWTLTGDVLHRGNVYVRLWNKSTSGWANALFGEMGKGMVAGGSAVTDPLAPYSVGPGGSTKLQPVAYPVNYDIHVFDNEVFLVCWDNLLRHFWLAFGQSAAFTDTPAVGNNLWIGGTQASGMPLGAGRIVGNENRPIVISMTKGGTASSLDDYNATSAALFWWNAGAASYTSDSDGYMLPRNIAPFNSLYTDSDGERMGGDLKLDDQNQAAGLQPYGNLVTAQLQQELFELGVNTLDGQLFMFPIIAARQFSKETKGVTSIGSGPRECHIRLRNARHFRLGRNQPHDIINVGGMRWKVYPWYWLDRTLPGGHNDLRAYTGTYGWAIKYTGP